MRDEFTKLFLGKTGIQRARIQGEDSLTFRSENSTVLARKPWKNFLLITILNGSALLFTGCGQSPETGAALTELNKPRSDADVSLSPEYNFSSFAGTACKTKVNLAVGTVKRYTGHNVIVLLTPENFDPTHPKYRPMHGMQLIETLPIGARLRIERLMKDNGIAGLLWVTATIEDGTNAPKAVNVDADLLAKNKFIWPGWSLSTNWSVNSAMLEEVK
jgi:hypothetical protein